MLYRRRPTQAGAVNIYFPVLTSRNQPVAEVTVKFGASLQPNWHVSCLNWSSPCRCNPNQEDLCLRSSLHTAHTHTHTCTMMRTACFSRGEELRRLVWSSVWLLYLRRLAIGQIKLQLEWCTYRLWPSQRRQRVHCGCCVLFTVWWLQKEQHRSLPKT